MARFSMSNETRARIPGASFASIAGYALGPDYDLTLTFVGAEEIRKLNKIYRGMDVPTDILSFPLSDREGEIYICPSESRRMAQEFDRDYGNFIVFLFIHGCAHLKGYDHGATMERIEADIRKKFKI